MIEFLSAAATAEAPPFWIQILPWVGIFAVFWFLLIRPQMRQQKQQLIRARLRTASDKYAAMSAEAAAERLAQNDTPSDVQDFASDDAAPPTEHDPNKPPNEPTWDGSGL